MQVHPATPEQADEIATVHVDSWRVAYAGLMPADGLDALSTTERSAMWRRAVEGGSPHVLVATHGNEVTGFVAFGRSRDSDAAPNCAEIWALYVAPRHWAKGVGRSLWLAALEAIGAQGYGCASLWVLEGNERAIAFYTAAGFERDQSPRQELSLWGTQLFEVRYVYKARG